MLGNLYFAVNNNVAIIFIAIILVLILAAFIYLKVRFKNAQEYLKYLENQKDRLFVLSLMNKIKRIETIGNNNVVYYEKYLIIKEKYDAIMSSFNNEFDKLHEGALIALTKKKGVLNKLIAISSLEQKTSSEISKLEKEVDVILKNDFELQAKEREITNIIDSCHLKVDENLSTLKFMKKEINEKFDDFAQLLNYFKDYVLRGSTLDANEVYDSLYEKATKFNEVLDNLPKYAETISNDLLNKANEVINDFNEMRESKYPLYSLSISNNIKEIKDLYANIVEDIRNFNIDGFDDRISNVFNKIKEISDLLTMEKSSKSEYDLRFNAIDKEADEICRSYTNLIQEYENLRKEYEITNDLENKETSNAVALLRALHNSMQSLQYEDYEYSTRNQKLNEIKNQIDIVREMFEKIKKDFSQFEDIKNNAQGIIDKALKNLRNIELDLINSEYEFLVNKYDDKLQKFEYEIEEICNLLSEDKIKIDVVKDCANELDAELNSTGIEIQNDIQKAKLVEHYIVYGNNYRLDHPDVENELIKAESQFNLGRIDDALNSCKKALSGYRVPDFVGRIKNDLSR